MTTIYTSGCLPQVCFEYIHCTPLGVMSIISLLDVVHCTDLHCSRSVQPVTLTLESRWLEALWVNTPTQNFSLPPSTSSLLWGERVMSIIRTHCHRHTFVLKGVQVRPIYMTVLVLTRTGLAIRLSSLAPVWGAWARQAASSAIARRTWCSPDPSATPTPCLQTLRTEDTFNMLNHWITL